MNQNVLTAAVAVISALIGGGVWSFASAWLTGRFHDEENEKGRLHADLRDAIAAHQVCEAKIETLERRLDVVEHHHASLVPRWIKNANKRLIWINGAAMVSIFGLLGRGRDQVEGCTFADIFDAEAAREVERLERAALAQPGRAVSTFLQLHAQLLPMHIVCVAGVGRDSELIYEGYAYCANDPADLADRGSRREQEQLGLSMLRIERPPPDPDVPGGATAGN
ncbi:MAG TPA: hypothetical protein VGF77_08535 [Allosphingosinicella sp.]|jgi:hypothetical protein